MASRTTSTGGRVAEHAPASVVDVGTEVGSTNAETVRTEDGTTLHVKSLNEAVAALGEAVATGTGGAGVGSHQIVEPVEGPATRTLRVDDGPKRPNDPGPLPLRHPSDPLAVEEAVVAYLDAQGWPNRQTAVVTRGGRNEILPLAVPEIDPALVPGRKIATAAAQVRRGGRSYKPGEPFPVDYRAHSELVPIGAIVATPWHDLPDHHED